MQRPLRGPVEVAPIDLGTTRQGVRGPRIRGQLTIAVAIEVSREKGLGRVRLCRIRDDPGDSLVSFVCDAVKPGAEVRTDKLLNNLPERGYSYIQVGRSAYEKQQDRNSVERKREWHSRSAGRHGTRTSS